MRIGTLCVLALLAAGCRSGGGIDHIIIGVPSLDQGIAAFQEATGVAPMRGGRHPLRGTENALASLGGGVYLEIIAPQAVVENPDGFVKNLRSLKRPSLVGWAVRTADATDAVSRIQKLGMTASTPAPGSRITPQGAKLEWKSFTIEQPQFATAPFFIQWSPSTTHPSVSSPSGCSLAAFELDDSNAADLSRLLGAFDISIKVREAPRPHMRLQLTCGVRRATFESE